MGSVGGTVVWFAGGTHNAAGRGRGRGWNGSGSGDRDRDEDTDGSGDGDGDDGDGDDGEWDGDGEGPLCGASGLPGGRLGRGFGGEVGERGSVPLPGLVATETATVAVMNGRRSLS